MSHGTYDIRMNESWHMCAMCVVTYGGVMGHINESWHVCTMTHLLVCRMCHDSVTSIGNNSVVGHMHESWDI